MRSATVAGRPQDGWAARSDAELVAAVRSGATDAWGEVYDRHLDRVYGVCFAVLRNSADAQDAAQVTFLKAVESIGQLREGGALGGWLSGIARRAAVDRIRANRETPFDEWPTGEPADEPDPSSEIRRREAVALVSDALDGLEARDRLALVLADVHGYDGDALADSLGVRRDHAYVLVRRARERFGRSVSAVVVGRSRCCPDLAALVGDDESSLDPRLRKRVARHIDGCERCRDTRDRRVSPAALLSLLPPVAAPDLLRAGLPASSGDAGSAQSSGGRRPRGPRMSRPHGIAAGMSVVVVGATGVVVAARDDPQTQPERPATRATPTAASADESADDDGDTYCGAAREWSAQGSGGPTSSRPEDVERWFTNEAVFVERLAAAAPSDGAAAWDFYRRAYVDLVESLRSAGWVMPAATAADGRLSDLRDEVRAGVETLCGVRAGP